MALEKHVEVTFSRNWEHEFFKFAGKDELDEVAERIQRKVSQVVFFIVDGVEKFGAIIDFHYGDLHLRAVGGQFPHMWQYLRNFCEGMAKALGFSAVTFRTKINAVKYLAKKAGYTYIGDDIYQKVL